MKIFAFLEPFFHALSDGKLIRLTVAWVLRILAVLMALLGLFWFIAFVGIGFKAIDSGMGSRSAGVLLGCILFALIGLCWGYLAAGIHVFRARSITELGDSHFTVLSILSILFRLQGEVIFVTYSLLGVGGCLFVWFAEFSPFSEMGMLGNRIPFLDHAGSGFLGGIELLVLMLLLAFGGIVLCYALAELSVVLVEIALNTRSLHAAPPEPVRAAPVLAAPQFAPQPTPRTTVQRVCMHCGQPLDAGSTFCAECGNPVA
jgi:hypothetical protein